MKKLLVVIGGICLILLSCCAGLIGGFVGSRVPNYNSSLSDLANSITQQVKVTDEQSSIIDVANQASPSVVSIVISKDLPKYYSNSFYDNYTPSDDESTVKQTVGAGSGFVISKDGMIITNRHVVEDTLASYTVVFNDGTKIDAKVLARDTILDIAFIKVEGKDTTPLELGSSANLKVGQTVVAIGNALGEFSNTVSSGIISGLSRNITASDSNGSNYEELTDVIQTDASINLGNSGGPLIDIDGKVIGVNVAIADAQNIGFAIPIDSVKDLISKLNDKGEIVRPSLGVRYIIVNSDIQESKNLSVDYGALVSKGNSKGEVAVIPNSPADIAGIKENDIILEINGLKIDETNTLQKAIQSFDVGDIISIKLLRGEIEKTVSATLANLNS